MSELSRHFESALEAKDRRIADLIAWGQRLSSDNFDQAQTIDENRARIAELKAALKDARDAALEEAALEIERIGHGSYPNKLITDGYASSVRSLKLLAARAAMGESDE